MHVDRTLIILNLGIIILVLTKIKGFYGMPTKIDERKQSKFLAPDALESDDEDLEDRPDSPLETSEIDDFLKRVADYPSHVPDEGGRGISTTSPPHKTNFDDKKQPEVLRTIPTRVGDRDLNETPEIEASVPLSSSLPIFREIFQRGETEERQSPVGRQPFSKDTGEEIPKVDDFFGSDTMRPEIEETSTTSTPYKTNFNVIKESEPPRSRPINIGDNETLVKSIEISSPRRSSLPIFRQILQRGEAEERQSPGASRHDLSQSPLSKGTEEEMVDEFSGSETMSPEREKKEVTNFNNIKNPELPRSNAIDISDRGLNGTLAESIETSVPKSSSLPVFRQILRDEIPKKGEEFSGSERGNMIPFQPVETDINSQEFLATEPGNVFEEESEVSNSPKSLTEKNKPTRLQTTTDHPPSISSHVSSLEVEEDEEEVVYQIPTKLLSSNQAIDSTHSQRTEFLTSAGSSSSVSRTRDEIKEEENIVRDVDSLPTELPEFFRTKATNGDDILLEELEVSHPNESIETESSHSGTTKSNSTPLFGQFSPQDKPKLDTQLPELFKTGPTHFLDEELEPSNTNTVAYTSHPFTSGISLPKREGSRDIFTELPQPQSTTEDPLITRLKELLKVEANKPPDKTTKGMYERFEPEPRERFPPPAVQQLEPPYSMYNTMSQERVLKYKQQVPSSGSTHQQITQPWRRETNRIPSGDLHGIPANMLEERLTKQLTKADTINKNTPQSFNSRKPTEIVESTPGNTEATRKTPTGSASGDAAFQDKSKGIFSRPGFTFREFTPRKKENQAGTTDSGPPPLDPLLKYRSRSIPSSRTDTEKIPSPSTSHKPTAGDIFPSIHSIYEHMPQRIDGREYSSPESEFRNFNPRALKPQDVANWNVDAGISSSPKRQSGKLTFNNEESPKKEFKEYQLFQSSNDLSKILSTYKESSSNKDKSLLRTSPDQDINTGGSIKSIESLPRSANIFGRSSFRNNENPQPTVKPYSLFDPPKDSYPERQISQREEQIKDVSTSSQNTQFVRQDFQAFGQTKQTGAHDTSSPTSSRSKDLDIDEISKRLQNNLTFQSFVRYRGPQDPTSRLEPYHRGDVPPRDIFPMDFDNKISSVGRFDRAVSPRAQQTSRLVDKHSPPQQKKTLTDEPEWTKRVIQYQPMSPRPEPESARINTENSPFGTDGGALLKTLIDYRRGETPQRFYDGRGLGAQQSYQSPTQARNFLTDENKEFVSHPSSPKNPLFSLPKMQQQKSSLSSMDPSVHLKPQQGVFGPEQQTPSVTLDNSPRTQIPTNLPIRPIESSMFKEMADRMFDHQPFMTFNKPEASDEKTTPIVSRDKKIDISSYQERPKSRLATLFPEITSTTFSSPQRYQLGQPETESRQPKTGPSFPRIESPQVVRGWLNSPLSPDRGKYERKDSETTSTDKLGTATSHSLREAQNKVQPMVFPTNQQKDTKQDTISQPAPVRFPDYKPGASLKLNASSSTGPKDILTQASQKSVHLPLSSDERQQPLPSLQFGNFPSDKHLGEVSTPKKMDPPRFLLSRTGSRKELIVPTTPQNQLPGTVDLVEINWPALAPPKSTQKNEPITKRIGERVPGLQPPQELDVELRISTQHPFSGHFRKEEKKLRDPSHGKDEVHWPTLPSSSKKDEKMKFPTVIEDDIPSVTFGSFPKQRSYREIISESKEKALQETQIFPRSSSSRVQPVSLPKNYDLKTDKAKEIRPTEISQSSQTALSFSDIVRRNAGKAMAKIHGTKEKVALGRIVHIKKKKNTSKRDDTRANTSEIPPDLCVLIIPKKKGIEVNVLDEIRRLNLNFPITKVKHYHSGSILFVCRSSEEVNRLQNAVQASQNIRIKSKKVFPREVQIDNLPKGVTKAEIFRSIYLKFHENPTEVWFVDYYDKNSKDIPKAAAIVVSKALMKGIEESPTVYIKGRNLDIDTSIRVPRCEKCKLLGHRADRCHNPYREYPSPDEPCIDCESYNKFHLKRELGHIPRNPKSHKTDAPNCLTKEYYLKKWKRNQEFFDENEGFAVEEEFRSGDRELTAEEEFYSAHSTQSPADEFYSIDTHLEQGLPEDIGNDSSDTNTSDDTYRK